MDDNETLHRRARLRELIESGFNGKQQDLINYIAHKTGRPPNQGEISSLKKDHGPKTFGDKKAKVLTEQIGLDRHWFSMPLGTAIPDDAWLANTDRSIGNALLSSPRPPLLQDSGVTIQIQSPVDSALSTLVQLVRSTDDLTRDQIKPLVNRMFDEPERAAEIAQRIGTTLQNTSPAPKPHGLTALLTPKTKKAPLESPPPPPEPPT